MQWETRAVRRGIGWSAGGFLFLFALYYAFGYYGLLAETPIGSFIEDMLFFLSRAAQVLQPLLMAALLFAISPKITTGRIFLYGAFAAMTRGIYTLPFDYLYFFSQGYETPDALLLSAAATVAEIALFWLCTVALVFLARLALYLRRKDSLPRRTPDLSFYDLSVPEALALFVAALPPFLYLFLSEIVNTVGYLVDYAGDYTVAEILYMTFSFLFDLGVFVLSLVLAVRIKRSADKEPLDPTAPPPQTAP